MAENNDDLGRPEDYVSPPGEPPCVQCGGSVFEWGIMGELPTPQFLPFRTRQQALEGGAPVRPVRLRRCAGCGLLHFFAV